MYLDVNILLLVIVTITQIGDIYSTYNAINIGVGKELNPVIINLFKLLGVIQGLVVSKIAFLSVYVFIFIYLGFIKNITGIIASLLISGFYSWVVYNNYRVIKKGK